MHSFFLLQVLFFLLWLLTQATARSATATQARATPPPVTTKRATAASGPTRASPPPSPQCLPTRRILSRWRATGCPASRVEVPTAPSSQTSGLILIFQYSWLLCKLHFNYDIDGCMSLLCPINDEGSFSRHAAPLLRFIYFPITFRVSLRFPKSWIFLIRQHRNNLCAIFKCSNFFSLRGFLVGNNHKCFEHVNPITAGIKLSIHVLKTRKLVFSTWYLFGVLLPGCFLMSIIQFVIIWA